MADVLLYNSAVINGTYGDEPATVNTPEISTLLISGLTAIKTADKDNWVDGVLTYTITITNNADEALTDATFSDTLTISLVNFVDDSVTINDVATTDFTYEESTGLLEVNLGDLATGSTTTVSFTVEKKTTT